MTYDPALLVILGGGGGGLALIWAIERIRVRLRVRRRLRRYTS